MAEGPAQRIEGELDITVAPEAPVLQEEEAYRYRLKAPVFTGLEDVEQFIQEFSEVIDITQWPPQVALIQLWMALTEQAKPYELGTSIDGIFAAGPFWHLRCRRQDPSSRVAPRSTHPLQDHTTTVKRLAQIAYSDLLEVHREHYTYDAFVQSLNDLGLHHQLQARGVTTIEDALREGEAYLLAKQLHRAHLSLQQVTVELKEDHNKLGHLTQMAPTTTHSP